MADKYIKFEIYKKQFPNGDPTLKKGYAEGNKDHLKTEWYEQIIKEFSQNKMELILEDPEQALNIFTRYDDDEGLKLMINNTNLDEKTKRIAGMQLDSILSNQNKIALAHQTPKHFERPRTDMTLEYRTDVVRAGRNPEFTDITYEGDAIY